MQKNMKQYLGLIVGVVGFATFLSSFYIVIGAGQLVTCEGDSCRACDLMVLMKTMIVFLRTLGSIIATIAFMWAGFKLITSAGNTESVSHAKHVFQNVVVGIILMFLSFTIIDTLMQMLVGNTFFNGARWDVVQCVANAPIGAASTTGTFSNTATPVSGVGLGVTGMVAASQEAAVRQQLASAGVTFNPGISPVGVSAQRLEEIAAMAQACSQAMGQSCNVVISSGVRTAGNPAGVGAHGTGLAVDISGRSDVFNTWMRGQSGFQPVASFRGYTAMRNPTTGTNCTWEPADGHSTAPHWHCQ